MTGTCAGWTADLPSKPAAAAWRALRRSPSRSRKANQGRVPAVDPGGAPREQNPLAREIQLGLAPPHPRAQAEPVVGGPEHETFHAGYPGEVEHVRGAGRGLDHQPEGRRPAQDVSGYPDRLT